jgi:hypothetical protein
MSEDKPHKPGRFEKRRERKRLKREHEGDTPEKREESSSGEYDAKEAKAKAGWSGLIGGGGFGG